MPKDFFLAPTEVKIEQVIARGHGHIRYEGGLTKYYFPTIAYVAKHTANDILTNSKTFRGYASGIYNSSLQVATAFVYNNQTNNNELTTLQGEFRYTDTRDLNGSNATGDSFVVTAGHVALVGTVARVRNSTAGNLSTSDTSDTSPVNRGSSAAVSAAVMFTSAFVEMDTGVTISGIGGTGHAFGDTAFFAGVPTTLTFSAGQNITNNLVITVPFRSAASSGNAPGMLIAFENSAGPDSNSDKVYRISVLSAGATVVSAFITTAAIVTAGAGGFVGTILASSIPTSGSYTVRVEEKRPAVYSSVPSGYSMETYAVCCQGVSTVSVSSTMTLSGLDTVVVTGGGAVTGGGEASVSTVLLSTALSDLAQDWTIQDVSVNLRSRVVSSSLGSLRLKPNDNAILGVVFHTGTYVVDPGVTAVQLAVRDSANSGAYRLYNTNTTIVSVGDANYYRMEVLANDEDLLTAQAANLLAGSNASQTLLGELQWVTTMGTFSSDSFAVNAANEIVREPDV